MLHYNASPAGPCATNWRPSFKRQVGGLLKNLRHAVLDDLIRHVRHGIVLTSMPPRPYGEASGHGDAKSASDVIQAMGQRGFVHDSAIMGAWLSVGTEAEGTPLLVFWTSSAPDEASVQAVRKS